MNDSFGSGAVGRNVPSQRMEQEVNDTVASRKVQKADREKLRRDRLNEQFSELGNALGNIDLGSSVTQLQPCQNPDRPKNDKATILNDTIQMLKDLTSQVKRLKTEYASLSEESRELTQEKNELKEEKAALKSEIDELNLQYQQRLRILYSWGAVEPSVVMGPPAYPFPVPVPIPSGPIPIHQMQPYPFFQSLGPGTVSNPFPVHMPYHSPCNPPNEQPSSQHTVQRPNHLDRRSKSSEGQKQTSSGKSDDFSDVATELELKTPGSAVPSDPKASHDQDLSGVRNGKRWQQPKGSTLTTGSSTNRVSSSCSMSSSSSSGTGDCSVAEN